MTLLQPQAPIIGAKDSFRLEYHGTYGKPVSDGGPGIRIEEEEGPLPRNRFTWDGEDFLGGLEEGQAKLVPFDIVRLYWGDPRSVTSPDGKLVFGKTTGGKGQVADIAPREYEVRRLCVLYGIYETNIHLLPLVVPKVTITNAEEVEIFCPAVDPEGTHVYGAVPDPTENHDLATTIAKMQSELKQLQRAYDESGGKKNDGADVTVDRPPSK